MTPIASLPMYDWPEVRAAVDRFWAAIRSTLIELGIDAPPTRDRPVESIEHWREPSLLLSQTCGLPLRRSLMADVAIVGAIDHRLVGTPPGSYHSVVIVGRDHPATCLADLHGAKAAVNGPDSQSGHAALRYAVVEAPAALGDMVESGSHRASIGLVSAGGADVAAIDAVSWELATAHEPAAAGCRVLARTSPTPGLPLITAAANAPIVPHLRAALAHGINALAEDDRAALHVHGLIACDADDYAVLDDRWNAATRAGVIELG